MEDNCNYLTTFSLVGFVKISQVTLVLARGQWQIQGAMGTIAPPPSEGQKNILNVSENKSSDKSSLYFRLRRPPVMLSSHFEGFEDILTP